MISISKQQYDALIDVAQLIHSERGFPMVYLTPDNYVIKLFYKRRWTSSSRLRPMAKRFELNARALRERDIGTVAVNQVFRCRSVGLDIVTYPFVAGSTVRDLNRETNDFGTMFLRFAEFIAELHLKGVYFKGLHFGNVLWTTERRFALIDVAHMTLRGRPLGISERVKNINNIGRYNADVESIRRIGRHRFLSAYLQKCGLTKIDQDRFLTAVLQSSRLFSET